MREFCFIYEKNLHSKFLKFKEKLNNFKPKIISQILKQKEKNLLIVAYNEKDWTLIKNLFYEFSANAIIGYYKKHFLKDYLKKQFNIGYKEKLFLECLKKYDIEYEKTLIYNFLDFSEDIDLKSYTYFKMNFLINKWKEMCLITSENVDLIKDYEIFKSLICFLFGKNPENKQSLKVNFLKNGVVAVKDKRIKYMKFKDFLLYLININPEKIAIKNEIHTGNKLYKNIFYDLFDKKIINKQKCVDKQVL